MQLIEPPRRLMATEFRGEMDDGESRPLLFVAYTEDWEESFEVVLKLREPGAPNPLHDGTGLACELLGAMLARVLGFKVPDYFIVEIQADLLSLEVDDAIAQRILTNQGHNFGSTYLRSTQIWKARRRPLGDTLSRFFGNLLEYDCVIVNADRDVEASNVLWNGEDCFPIDHSGILYSCRADDARYKRFLKRPLLPDPTVQVHVGFQMLEGRVPGTNGVFPKWEELPVDEILSEIRAVLPPQWESNPGDFDRIFDLLHRRVHHLQEISSQLRRLAS